MPGRTSTRQAAAKANEAFQSQSKPRGGTRKAGIKRKGSAQESQIPPTKAKRKNEEENEQEKEPLKEGQTQVEQPKEEREENKAEVKKKEGEKKKGEKEEAGEEPAAKMTEGKPEKKSPPVEEIEKTAVEQSEERAKTVPSNILEKGIVYFFFRPRVSVEDPESIEDVARSFIVLRPLPRDAKLNEGPIGDDENCRLLVLPKKKIPTSSRERYMGFVEKAGVNVKTLRESFQDREYETKTKGQQHVAPATPLAEGVYAITSTGRSSHLAYIITIPSELSEVQTDFGLRNRGSFVVSAKNPKFPGPASARLPKKPDYPQE
ncbi:hypothetical protein VTO42DRAFT_3514 [Malbranchea cinnamomea]